MSNATSNGVVPCNGTQIRATWVDTQGMNKVVQGIAVPEDTSGFWDFAIQLEDGSVVHLDDTDARIEILPVLPGKVRWPRAKNNTRDNYAYIAVRFEVTYYEDHAEEGTAEVQCPSLDEARVFHKELDRLSEQSGGGSDWLQDRLDCEGGGYIHHHSIRIVRVEQSHSVTQIF
jgi:hypothetical protein